MKRFNIHVGNGVRKIARRVGDFFITSDGKKYPCEQVEKQEPKPAPGTGKENLSNVITYGDNTRINRTSH